MNLIEHFVNGKIIPGSSDKKGKVFNPATGEHESEVRLASKSDLDGAVEGKPMNQDVVVPSAQSVPDIGVSEGATKILGVTGSLNFNQTTLFAATMSCNVSVTHPLKQTISNTGSATATGFLIENGEFKYPINEITIAGNFKEMFQNLNLANDLELEYSINSPTILIEGMVVAGK